MKILIIEDEAPAVEKLKRQLLKIEAEIEIMNILDSVRESVEWLRQNEPDLIFCDIHLSDGLSFRIFEKINDQLEIV